MKKSQAISKSSVKTTKSAARKTAATSPIKAEKTNKSAVKKNASKEEATAPKQKAAARRQPVSSIPAKTSLKKTVAVKTLKTVKKSEAKKSPEKVKITGAKPSKPEAAIKPAAVKSAVKKEKLPKATELKKTATTIVSPKKPAKTSLPATKGEKTPGKETAKTIRAGKAVIPKKKLPGKSSEESAAAKTVASKKKTTKPADAKKPEAEKVTKSAAPKKKEVQPVKAPRGAAKTETKTAGKKTSAKATKTEKSVVPSAKSIGPAKTKETPVSTGSRAVAETKKGKTVKDRKVTVKTEVTVKKEKSPAEKSKTASRKTIKSKATEGVVKPQKKENVIIPKEGTGPSRSAVRIRTQQAETTPMTTAVPVHAEAGGTFAAPSPLPAKKHGKTARLKIFLPDEGLPPEEVQTAPSPVLPQEYGENELLLMEVDPLIVFVSWEIRPEDIAHETDRLALRVYDVTGIEFDGSNANRYFDIGLCNRVDSKFIDIKMPGRDVIMEVGLLNTQGEFFAIKQSNRVSMPALQPLEEFGITGLLSDADIIIGY